LGATSVDTQREIGEIRKDVASALDELDARVRGTFDVASHARAAQDSPMTLAGVAVVGLMVGGFVAYKVVANARRRRRPEERLKRTMREAADELSERFERAREAMPVGIRLHAGGDDDDENRTLEVQGSDPSMLKRILWATLAATMMAGAGLLARRLSAAVWKAAMNEEPPTAKV
jgi:hypothetical protein